MFNRFSSREEGQGLVEYALILVLVAIVVIAVLLQLGPEIRRTFCTITSYLQQGEGVLCGGGQGAITGISASYTPASYTTPNATLKVTVTVSSNTTVTVTGDGGISGSQSCSGTCTFTFTNPSVTSGAVTAKDSAGGEGVVAFW